jgi:hypothetical protein
VDVAVCLLSDLRSSYTKFKYIELLPWLY